MNNLRRIQKELREFKLEAEQLNCTGGPEGDNLTKWLVVLTPPESSMYFGAKIQFSITFAEDYPFSPPNIVILTKTFHPNIIDDKICIEMIKKDWNA